MNKFSRLGRYGRRLLTVSAVSALVLGGISVPEAQAAGCTAWALQDRKDGTVNMFGAGGVTCTSRESLIILTVTMFGDKNELARKRVECSNATACSANTALVQDRWSGNQEWCTKTSALMVWGERRSEWSCVLH